MNKNRRLILKSVILAPLALPFPRLAGAILAGERNLSFYHTHTGEKLSVVYHDGSDYLSEPLISINSYLRDFRTGDVQVIDPSLLDQLFVLKRLTGSTGVYEVISGYRSPRTNSKLRRNNGGVAKKSLHMEGRAIDVRLTDVASPDLRKAAVSLKSGGVGYYRRSDFVHLDTGRYRTW